MSKTIKKRILPPLSVELADNLRKYCAAWVGDNIQGLRIWPRNKWIALAGPSEQACRLNIFTTHTPEGAISHQIRAYLPFDGFGNILPEDRGVEINYAAAQKNSAHEITYHIDLNNLDSTPIPLYSVKSDIYRAPAAQDKFISWVEDSCAPEKNGSILAAAFYELLVRTPEKMIAFVENTDLSRPAAHPLTAAVNFLIDKALPQINKELVASLLAQRPDEKNALATYYALREARDSFAFALSSPLVTACLGAAKDLSSARRAAGTDIKISETMESSAHEIKKLEGFARLCDDLRGVYQMGGWGRPAAHLLMSPDLILATLSTNELANCPRVVPGKCRLASKTPLRTVAPDNLLPPAHPRDLLAPNSAAVRVPLAENEYYHGTEQVIVRDKSMLKIMRTPEMKIGIARE